MTFCPIVALLKGHVKSQKSFFILIWWRPIQRSKCEYSKFYSLLEQCWIRSSNFWYKKTPWLWILRSCFWVWSRKGMERYKRNLWSCWIGLKWKGLFYLFIATMIYDRTNWRSEPLPHNTSESELHWKSKLAIYEFDKSLSAICSKDSTKVRTNYLINFFMICYSQFLAYMYIFCCSSWSEFWYISN